MTQFVSPGGLSVSVGIGTAKVNRQVRLTGLSVVVSIGLVRTNWIKTVGVPVVVGIGRVAMIRSLLPAGIEVSVYS